MISKEKKAELILKFGKKTTNTGSPEAQIAILTHDISNLTEHLKINKKDIVTRRSLLKKVAYRKKLLKYVNSRNPENYKNLIKELKLRK